MYLYKLVRSHTVTVLLALLIYLSIHDRIHIYDPGIQFRFRISRDDQSSDVRPEPVRPRPASNRSPAAPREAGARPRATPLPRPPPRPRPPPLPPGGGVAHERSRGVLSVLTHPHTRGSCPERTLTGRIRSVGGGGGMMGTGSRACGSAADEGARGLQKSRRPRPLRTSSHAGASERTRARPMSSSGKASAAASRAE